MGPSRDPELERGSRRRPTTGLGGLQGRVTTPTMNSMHHGGDVVTLTLSIVRNLDTEAAVRVILRVQKSHSVGRHVDAA